ncbi:MAG: PilN domain-containing protein [Pseudomonadota bacterium]
MTDFNLIPNEYLVRRRRSRYVRLYAFLLAGSLVLNGVTFGYFTQLEAMTKNQVEVLQTKQAATAQQRSQLSVLDARRNNYESELKILAGLRSGGAAKTMFTTIDRALPDKDVWFLDWQFRRAGVLVTSTQEAVNTGYFIVVPDKGTQTEDQPWRVQTHMTIKGQAKDHVALSTFVRNLFAQPEIEDVRVRRTTLRSGQSSKNVEFDLAIVLNTEIGVRG